MDGAGRNGLARDHFDAEIFARCHCGSPAVNSADGRHWCQLVQITLVAAPASQPLFFCGFVGGALREEIDHAGGRRQPPLVSDELAAATSVSVKRHQVAY